MKQDENQLEVISEEQEFHTETILGSNFAAAKVSNQSKGRPMIRSISSKIDSENDFQDYESFYSHTSFLDHSQNIILPKQLDQNKDEKHGPMSDQHSQREQ